MKAFGIVDSSVNLINDMQSVAFCISLLSSFEYFSLCIVSVFTPERVPSLYSFTLTASSQSWFFKTISSPGASWLTNYTFQCLWVCLMSELVTHYVCGHRGFPTVEGGKKKKKKKEKPSFTLQPWGGCTVQLTAGQWGQSWWITGSERERERERERRVVVTWRRLRLKGCNVAWWQEYRLEPRVSV